MIAGEQDYLVCGTFVAFARSEAEVVLPGDACGELEDMI